MYVCKIYLKTQAHQQVLVFMRSVTKDISNGPVYVVFYNKLPWFVSELPEKEISNRGGPV
jgi:hypothetical protein